MDYTERNPRMDPYFVLQLSWTNSRHACGQSNEWATWIR